MVRLLAVLVLAGASVNAESLLETFGSGANQFQIEFVAIGNPGNAADTTGSPNPAGSVDYVYNIGKYEISRDQINKANAVGDLEITLQDMTEFGGNGGSRPATGITWYEAARFVNYLNTSQGKQNAYRFNESGKFQLWEVEDSASGGTNRLRHKDAVYFLPSMDEWYKAAYYDPAKVGGAGYWKFPTASDHAPKAISGGKEPATAVYGQDLPFAGPADTTNAGGLSAYGTMAQGGNVWEWNECAYPGTDKSENADRAIRGGSWFYDFSGPEGVYREILEASSNWNHDPNREMYTLGFRIARKL